MATILMAVCLAASACGSSDKDPKRAAVEAVSWAATTRMVAEAWRAGEVPRAYAERTLDAGRRALRESVRRGPNDLTPSVQRLLEAAGAVKQAVERGDRAALTEPLRAVEDSRAKLARVAEGSGR